MTDADAGHGSVPGEGEEVPGSRIRKMDAEDADAFDRREFLKLGALAGGGLLLGVTLPGRAAASDARGMPVPDADALSPSAFLRVDADGTVTIWMARAEMGQGVKTALPMAVADELDADWASVEVVQAEAHPEKWGRQMTVGSSSVRNGAWLPLRRAGAAAREMLVAAAAARWDVEPGACRTRSGEVVHEGSGRALGYGDLAGEAASLPVPESPDLKDPSEFTLVGTSPPRRDTPAKVDGEAVYGADVRVPGMLHATVVRPPAVGASVGSVDAAAARSVPGVRDTVRISSGIAVVADHTWAAFRGAEELDVTWEGGFETGSAGIARRLDDLLEGPRGAAARDDGDVDAALEGAAHRAEASYRTPYLAHATMEPMNATARVEDGTCEVWAPTQNPQGAQRAAAELADVGVEDVTVHVTYLGCGWGRRGAVDYVEDAVETAREVGAPVQVLWTREQDVRHDLYRPTSHARLAGAVDGDGRLSALRIHVAAPPIGVQWGAGEESGVDRNAVDGLANAPYRVPNVEVDYRRSDVPVPTGYWRSVGPSQNTWVLESFVDELAHAAGRDPLQFRLEMLGDDPRLRRVLELCAERAGWGDPPPGGRARGIGLVRDKGGRVAQIAEVSDDGGEPRVHRITLAADCGQVIHPGIVEEQLAGAALAGLGAALRGEVTLEEGRVVPSNFDDYPLLRMPEAPEVDVHLVDSHEEPGGVGEPGLPPAAPAVTNAWFALTGERLRELPISG